MKYYVIDKPPHEAISKVREVGGRLYDGHYCYSVVSGSDVFTYWKATKDATKVRADIDRLCKDWGLTDLEMSPGRLIRSFLKMIGLERAENLPKTNKARFYGVKYEYLARDRPIHCRLKELLQYYQHVADDSPDSRAAAVLLSQVITLCVELRKQGNEREAQQYERAFAEAWDADEIFAIAEELGIDNIDLDDSQGIETLDQLYQCEAMQGNDSHWHYLYLSDKPTGIGIELDIKAAYLTSFLQEKTIYWLDGGRGKSCWLPDGGVMNRLRECGDSLPKWFRLQLLGMLSSHQRTFSYLGKNGLLERETENVIQWGAAFNTTHKAIYRVYALMKEIHEIGEKWIHRMHTDSFLLDIATPKEIEQQIIDLLDSKGFKVSCKGIGYFHFFNRDLGFVGLFEKGEQRLLDESYRSGVKPKGLLFPPPIFQKAVERWQHYLPVIPQELQCKTNLRLRPLKSDETFTREPMTLKGVWEDG